MQRIVKQVWKQAVPEVVRSSRIVTSLKSRVLPHDWIYDSDYYQTEVDTAARESAPAMARTLCDVFAPLRVVDVGCGTGALAAAFQARGVAVTGLEYADAALAMCHDRGVDARKFDIETAGSAPADLRGSDLVVSFEVAEHLPASIADDYVRLMSQMADHVVISAAPPGQGGTDHVNEQPKSYWVEKFAAHGMRLDEDRGGRVVEGFAAAGTVVGFYMRNTFAFVRD